MEHLITSFDKYDLFLVIATAIIVTIISYMRKATTLSWDHFWQNLDKFLLVALFILCLLIAVTMIHHKAEASSLSWIEDITKQLLSAILTLLGARALVGRAQDRTTKNGNGDQPNASPPVVPPSTSPPTTV